MVITPILNEENDRNISNTHELELRKALRAHPHISIGRNKAGHIQIRRTDKDIAITPMAYGRGEEPLPGLQMQVWNKGPQGSIVIPIQANLEGRQISLSLRDERTGLMRVLPLTIVRWTHTALKHLFLASRIPYDNRGRYMSHISDELRPGTPSEYKWFNELSLFMPTFACATGEPHDPNYDVPAEPYYHYFLLDMLLKSGEGTHELNFPIPEEG